MTETPIINWDNALDLETFLTKYKNKSIESKSKQDLILTTINLLIGKELDQELKKLKLPRTGKVEEKKKRLEHAITKKSHINIQEVSIDEKSTSKLK